MIMFDQIQNYIVDVTLKERLHFWTHRVDVGVVTRRGKLERTGGVREDRGRESCRIFSMRVYSFF